MNIFISFNNGLLDCMNYNGAGKERERWREKSTREYTWSTTLHPLNGQIIKMFKIPTGYVFVCVEKDSSDENKIVLKYI